MFMCWFMAVACLAYVWLISDWIGLESISGLRFGLFQIYVKCLFGLRLVYVWCMFELCLV